MHARPMTTQPPVPMAQLLVGLLNAIKHNATKIKALDKNMTTIFNAVQPLVPKIDALDTKVDIILEAAKPAPVLKLSTKQQKAIIKAASEAFVLATRQHYLEGSTIEEIRTLLDASPLFTSDELDAQEAITPKNPFVTAFARQKSSFLPRLKAYLLLVDQDNLYLRYHVPDRDHQHRNLINFANVVLHVMGIINSRTPKDQYSDEDILALLTPALVSRFALLLIHHRPEINTTHEDNIKTNRCRYSSPASKNKWKFFGNLINPTLNDGKLEENARVWLYLRYGYYHYAAEVIAGPNGAIPDDLTPFSYYACLQTFEPMSHTDSYVNLRAPTAAADADAAYSAFMLAEAAAEAAANSSSDEEDAGSDAGLHSGMDMGTVTGASAGAGSLMYSDSDSGMGVGVGVSVSAVAGAGSFLDLDSDSDLGNLLDSDSGEESGEESGSDSYKAMGDGAGADDSLDLVDLTTSIQGAGVFAAFKNFMPRSSVAGSARAHAAAASIPLSSQWPPAGAASAAIFQPGRAVATLHDLRIPGPSALVPAQTPAPKKKKAAKAMAAALTANPVTTLAAAPTLTPAQKKTKKAKGPATPAPSAAARTAMTPASSAASSAAASAVQITTPTPAVALAEASAAAMSAADTAAAKREKQATSVAKGLATKKRNKEAKAAEAQAAEVARVAQAAADLQETEAAAATTPPPPSPIKKSTGTRKARGVSNYSVAVDFADENAAAKEDDGQPQRKRRRVAPQ